MRVVDVVARCLYHAGVKTFFGVVGSGNFTFTTSLHALGARFVAARHENVAVCMADAHARVTGDLGCVSVHQGPGLTNAMTGLTEAAKARTPLVLVAADTPAGAVRSNFYVDQDKLAEAVGAVPVRANRPATAYEDTQRAIRVARAERRAVLLNLPLDVSNLDAAWRAREAGSSIPAPPSPSPRAGRQILDALGQAGRPPAPPPPSPGAGGQTLEAMGQASRPLIVAGRGPVVPAAREPLEALSE